MRNSQEIYTLHKITITENINNYVFIYLFIYLNVTIHIDN